MTTWRLAASNTHLYSGARLRCLDEPGGAPFARGDTVLVEFSDGNVVTASLLDAAPAHVTLSVPGFQTARGALVAPRQWAVMRGPDRSRADLLTVRARAR